MALNKKFIEFHEKIGKLKHLRRIGWVLRGVPKAETVGSHSWRMAIMAMQKENELKRMGADVDEVIAMSLIHDIGEAIIGDIIPEKYQVSDKKISRDEKILKEKSAIHNLAGKYNFPKLENLFDKLETVESIEAQIVTNLDKLDLLLQAYEYKKQYPEIKRLDEFIPYNEESINLPIFQEDLAEIKSRYLSNTAQNNKFIDFQILMGKLKHLERSGPQMYEIKDCETVAAHCFRTAVMALYLEDDLKSRGLNVSEIIKTALVHDAGEAVIGDIVPEKWQKGRSKISKEQKHKMEIQATINMAKDFDVPFVWTTFNNMEQRITPDASMAKDLEIFESIQQAYEYIKIYPEKAILREYIPYHRPRIESDLVINLVDSVKEVQDIFLTSKNFPTFYNEGGR